MNEHPMDEIEDKKGMTDLGHAAFLIFTGAKEEGATEREAIMMVAAFFAGSAYGNNLNEKDDESEENE